MPPRKRPATPTNAADYRHDETRLNNPPAGIADMNPLPPARKRYAYDPRLDPQLQWAGKAEHLTFDVETVPLHIHERVSPAAIVESLRTGPVQASLFADPEFDLNQAVEFYQHPQPWANRLVLGDSLLVMNSLLERELMAGKVQTIYFDPPYGINYSSNFQPFTNKRDVKDRADGDLTREPEQIRAFRDTWELGIHSYLTYIRDRLLLMREMLTETGSIFVQISDENVHRVRAVMDEIFGASNFFAQINFKSTSPLGQKGIAKVYDYLIWYAKDIEQIKFRPVFADRDIREDREYRFIDDNNHPDGYRKISDEEFTRLTSYEGVFRRSKMTSSGFTPSCTFTFTLKGVECKPFGGKGWRTNREGIDTLIAKQRLFLLSSSPYCKQYHYDFPYIQIENSWTDQPPPQARMYAVPDIVASSDA